MNIGELARHAGVSIQTVRFYERRGLLPPPARTPAGYRFYRPDAVFALRNIRALQAVGFTLNDIMELAEHERILAADHHSPARKSLALTHILTRANHRLSIMDRQLQDLGRKKRELELLIEAIASSDFDRGFALPTEIAGLRRPSALRGRSQEQESRP